MAVFSFTVTLDSVMACETRPLIIRGIQSGLATLVKLPADALPTTLPLLVIHSHAESWPMNSISLLNFVLLFTSISGICLPAYPRSHRRRIP